MRDTTRKRGKRGAGADADTDAGGTEKRRSGQMGAGSGLGMGGMSSSSSSATERRNDNAPRVAESTARYTGSRTGRAGVGAASSTSGSAEGGIPANAGPLGRANTGAQGLTPPRRHSRSGTNRSTTTTTALLVSTASPNVSPYEPPARSTPNEPRPHTNPTSPPPSPSPSTSSDTTTPDPSCPHPIHPSYTHSYPSPLCPSCRMEICIRALETTNTKLMTHGGSNQWGERVLRMRAGARRTAEANECRFWRGRGKSVSSGGKRGVRLWRRGEEWSYPTSRVEIVNLVVELEGRRGREVEYEKREAVRDGGYAAQGFLLDEARRMGATAALGRYDAFLKRGDVNAVERASMAYSRKRAREVEIATSDHFPDSQHVFEAGTWVWSREQKAFIHAALSSSKDSRAEEQYAPDPATPSRRKRRRLSATVSFHPLVYIRTTSDIDALCNPTGLWKDIAHQQSSLPHTTSRGILRTAPENIDPAPRRAHTVTRLHSQDRQAVAPHVWKGRTRWRPGPGWDRVDTSGCCYGHEEDVHWRAWALYVDSLAGRDGGGEDHGRAELTTVVEEYGIDADELPLPAEQFTLEQRIAQRTAQGHAEAALGSAGPVPVDGQDVMSSPSERGRRQQTRQGQQSVDQSQERRSLTEDRRSRASFRPHGGMASVFAFGSLACRAAVGFFRRRGVSL